MVGAHAYPVPKIREAPILGEHKIKRDVNIGAAKSSIYSRHVFSTPSVIMIQHSSPCNVDSFELQFFSGLELDCDSDMNPQNINSKNSYSRGILCVLGLLKGPILKPEANFTKNRRCNPSGKFVLKLVEIVGLILMKQFSLNHTKPIGKTQY